MQKIIWNIILLSFLSLNFAQEADTTSANPFADSLTIANQDTSAAADTSGIDKEADINAVVYASASDSLTFDVQNKKMYIYGTGELKYKQTNLTSGQIAADFVSSTLTAKGIVDTADTSGQRYIQTPTLSESGQVYEGARLNYNFKNQRGFISLAKNIEEGSRYEGQKVKKVDKEVYFIEDGIYTTCEDDTPHTYFSASEMKVIQGDKIIAKWIFLYLGGVPLPLPLPFAVFPNESGRRSGIIFPGYGQDASRGQYFRNFGYFWAISDYMDLALTGDYYTKGGYGMRGRYRYAKRYEYTGSANGGYSVITVGEEGDPARSEQTDWNLSLFHNHQIDPSLRLDVNLQFQSSTYLNNNAVSYNDLLTQDVISNATLQKRWDESGNSLTINYSRRQNLESGNINEVLPNMTFSKALTYPFKDKKSKSRDQSWYEMISYNYSGQFRNERNKTEGDLKIRGGIQHNISSSASPKIGYFSISPRVNYREKWYNKKTQQYVVQVPKYTTQIIEGEPVSVVTFADSMAERDVKQINAVRTFDFGLSASTKIYGMWQPQFLGIDAFRHTIQPSISYNYNPDFSKEFWGYYEEYKQSDGTIVRYDPYRNEVFSGVPASESQSINMNIGNIFEMKTMKDPTDTTSEAKKLQLLNLSAGMGYNFAADSLRLSDLRVSYRTQIGDLLSFNGSSSYTFYDYDGSRKINTFLASQGKGLFRLTNFSFSISTTLSGDKIKGESRSGEERYPESEFDTFNRTDYIDLYQEEANPDFSIPWNLSLNYNYSLSKTNPSDIFRTSNIGANLSFSLTENWKFTFRGNYDFERKEISAPQITIYRDLHCWEMNLTWNPLGTYRGFRFEIRLKAPELQDVKVTKSKGLFTGRR